MRSFFARNASYHWCDVRVHGRGKKSPNSMRATNRFSLLKPGLLAWISLAVAVAGACTMFSELVYADGDGKSSKTKASSSGEEQKLTGQQLYATNCNRCHSERYPTEWTAAHWRTLMTHMRVRANLPAEQAKEILKYLEQDAGN
jgi:mono/diheme cytochrome c family protein